MYSCRTTCPFLDPPGPLKKNGVCLRRDRLCTILPHNPIRVPSRLMTNNQSITPLLLRSNTLANRDCFFSFFSPDRADDLIPEENHTVQLAIKRLPQKEVYDRVFRMRRAFQCSLSHTLLPKEEQTKPEEVCPLIPLVSFQCTIILIAFITGFVVLTV